MWSRNVRLVSEVPEPLTEQTFRTKPRNLDLAVKLNDEYYYISPNEWNVLTYIEQEKFTRLGVYIFDGEQEYLLSLYDSIDELSWAEAKKRYGDLIPSDRQATLLSNFTQYLTKMDKYMMGRTLDPDYDVIITQVIKDYGGDAMHGWYWSQPEEGESDCHGIVIRTGWRGGLNTIKHSAKVIPVAPLKSTRLVLPRYRKEPRDLDLVVKLKNDSLCYIRAEEWKRMPQNEKDECTKLGVYIDSNTDETPDFMVSLDDTEPMLWKKAMSVYGDKLPTLEQGKLLQSNHEALNEARLTYGGNQGENARQYWTRTESKRDVTKGVKLTSLDSGIYYIDLAFGNIHIDPFAYSQHRVMTVSELP